ncbi:hypothetical protein CMI48_03445 [Candidatus Pacearchaeota archaeon]|nr:hypothetical protein [Candidatus Pacearchaeota archaeon]
MVFGKRGVAWLVGLLVVLALVLTVAMWSSDDSLSSASSCSVSDVVVVETGTCSVSDVGTSVLVASSDVVEGFRLLARSGQGVYVYDVYAGVELDGVRMIDGDFGDVLGVPGSGSFAQYVLAVEAEVVEVLPLFEDACGEVVSVGSCGADVARGLSIWEQVDSGFVEGEISDFSDKGRRSKKKRKSSSDGVVGSGAVGGGAFPQLAVQSPVAGELFNITTIPLTFTTSGFVASAGSCFFSLNGGANMSLPGCVSSSFAVSEGTHTVVVRAFDQIGRFVEIQRGFIVDLTAPVLTSLVSAPALPANLTSGENVSVDMVVSEFPVDMLFRLVADLDGFEVNRSGTTRVDGQSDLPLVFSVPERLEVGNYTLLLRATDLAGNGVETVVGQVQVPFVFSGLCSDDQTILRVHDFFNNAHASRWDQSGIRVCYSEIFGRDFVSSGDSHACFGSNGVVRLTGVMNAHVQEVAFGLFAEEVCFGDLSCSVRGGRCVGDEREVISLSQGTNAHVNVAPLGAYGNRVCCSSVQAS